MGQPLPCGTLFLKITVEDYVPDGMSNFAEALANPIKFQSDLDKRTKQLAVFADEMDQSVNPDDVSIYTLYTSLALPPWYNPRTQCLYV